MTYDAMLEKAHFAAYTAEDDGTMYPVVKAALAAIGITPEAEVWIAPVTPTEEMLEAYWRAMPSPFDLDTENDAEAIEHFRAMRLAHTGEK